MPSVQEFAFLAVLIVIAFLAYVTYTKSKEDHAVLPEKTPEPIVPILRRAMLYPNDRAVPPGIGYSLSMVCNDLAYLTEAVKEQSSLPGGVILWGGFTKAVGFAQFKDSCTETLKYDGKFTHAYVYDEMFGSEPDIQMGKDEAAILDAAAFARAHGLRAVVSILPEVILNPAFELITINEYDVIAIDMYPSIHPGSTSGMSQHYQLSASANVYTNILYACISVLRDMGYVGEIWYIYQAFGLRSEPMAETILKLTLQRETLELCASMGVAGVVPWGLYLSPDQTAKEPDLYQGQGTELEGLVRF